MKKSFLFLHRKDFWDYLNLGGVIFFSIIFLFAFAFYRNVLERQLLKTLYFLFIYHSFTFDNKMIFPYKYKAPTIFFINQHVVFKHLFWSFISYQYLSLIVGMILTLLIHFYYFDALLLCSAFLAVILNVLSRIFLGLSMAIFRSSLLIVPFLIYSTNESMALLCLIVVAGCFLLDYNIHFPHFSNRLRYEKRKEFIPRSLFEISTRFYLKNRSIPILFIVVGFIISYCCYKYFRHFFENTPLLLLTQTLFITILEILIGNQEKDIFMDRSRAILSSLNRQTFKEYIASSLFNLTLCILLVEVGMIVGIAATASLSYVIQNGMLLPCLFLVSFIYYRKIELLIEGTENILLRFTLPILYLFLIMLVVGGRNGR